MAKLEGFFASASNLEMQKDINRQQVHLARQLVNTVNRLQTLEGFQADERYWQLVKKSKDSLVFLEAVSGFLDDFQNQVLETSAKAKKLIADTTEKSRNYIRKR